MALNKAEVVETYIKLRDRRAQRKKAYEAEDAGDKEKQDKIETYLLREFQESGVESIKTSAGTAYKSSRVSATVADWDSFFTDYVVPNQAWEMLERRCSKEAVQQYKAANDDLPPGINWTETVTVNVRRS
jgi:hypothetical protein